MDVTGTATLHAPVERVFAEIADLSTYPAWLGIVLAATPVAAVDADAGPAWLVDLGARVGPLRRAKRVRMVRTVLEAPNVVVFERAERDGRPHSVWRLDGHAVPHDSGTHLRMALHYGGGVPVPGLDLVLKQEIRRAGARLGARLT